MVSMREMLEAGCHFGHQTRFWNPKMGQYIFGARNKIHIINLEKTVAKFEEACKFARQLSAQGGKILFVDAKRGGREIIAAEAQRCGSCWVDQRWLGGTLTNFKTVCGTIKRLKDMEQQLEDGSAANLTKKEALDFQRNVEKLNKSIGGIKEMSALPDALFIVDVGYHKIAIQEANKLGIPVIGIVTRTTLRMALTTLFRAMTTPPRLSPSTPAASLTPFWPAVPTARRKSLKPPLTKSSSKWLLKPKNSPLPNFG